jgi:hypothetical protein
MLAAVAAVVTTQQVVWAEVAEAGFHPEMLVGLIQAAVAAVAFYIRVRPVVLAL